MGADGTLAAAAAGGGGIPCPHSLPHSVHSLHAACLPAWSAASCRGGCRTCPARTAAARYAPRPHPTPNRTRTSRHAALPHCRWRPECTLWLWSGRRWLRRRDARRPAGRRAAASRLRHAAWTGPGTRPSCRQDPAACGLGRAWQALNREHPFRHAALARRRWLPGCALALRRRGRWPATAANLRMVSFRKFNASGKTILCDSLNIFTQALRAVCGGGCDVGVTFPVVRPVILPHSSADLFRGLFRGLRGSSGCRVLPAPRSILFQAASYRASPTGWISAPPSWVSWPCLLQAVHDKGRRGSL